jgi:hypothetical protein
MNADLVDIQFLRNQAPEHSEPGPTPVDGRVAADMQATHDDALAPDLELAHQSKDPSGVTTSMVKTGSSAISASMTISMSSGRINYPYADCV